MKTKSVKKRKTFSLETIKRLGLYLRNLKRIKEQDVKIISSGQITRFLNVTPVQFRKDLSYFGGFGKRGVGYDVDNLIQEIENILGLDKKCRIVIVGIGRLGSALLGYDGFSRFNIEIAYAFDSDKNKIGGVCSNIKIYDVSTMKNILQKNPAKIAIVSTPPEVAQDITDKLVNAGIKGILNFAPIILKVPENVWVSNVDMACELESLIFFAK